MSLDLENVQREEDNFADPNYAVASYQLCTTVKSVGEPTFQQSRALWPSPSPSRTRYRTFRHGVMQDNLARKVVHRICISVEESTCSVSPLGYLSAGARCPRTLYPAAYPNPGNSDINLLPADSAAYCLKMTVLKFATDVICWTPISATNSASDTESADSSLVAHQSFRNRIDLQCFSSNSWTVPIGGLTGWKIASSAIPADPRIFSHCTSPYIAMHPYRILATVQSRTPS